MFLISLIAFNSAICLCYAYSNYKIILAFISNKTDTLIEYFKYHTGVIKRIKDTHWYDYSLLGGYGFTSAQYTSSTTINGTITANTGTIVASNLTFSNNIQTVTVQELAKVRDEFDQMRKDFYDYKVKSNLLINDLMKEKEN